MVASMRRLFEALGIAAGAVTAFWWLVPGVMAARKPSTLAALAL